MCIPCECCASAARRRRHGGAASVVLEHLALACRHDGPRPVHYSQLYPPPLACWMCGIAFACVRARSRLPVPKCMMRPGSVSCGWLACSVWHSAQRAMTRRASAHLRDAPGGWWVMRGACTIPSVLSISSTIQVPAAALTVERAVVVVVVVEGSVGGAVRSFVC
jgi:hypothetical protein